MAGCGGSGVDRIGARNPGAAPLPYFAFGVVGGEGGAVGIDAAVDDLRLLVAIRPHAAAKTGRHYQAKKNVTPPPGILPANPPASEGGLLAGRGL